MLKRDLVQGELYAVGSQSTSLPLNLRCGQLVDLSTKPSKHWPSYPQVTMRIVQWTASRSFSPADLDNLDREEDVWCRNVLMPWEQYQQARAAEKLAYRQENQAAQQLIEQLRLQGINSLVRKPYPQDARQLATRMRMSISEEHFGQLVRQGTWDQRSSYLASLADLRDPLPKELPWTQRYRIHRPWGKALAQHYQLRAFRLWSSGLGHQAVELGVDDLKRILADTEPVANAGSAAAAVLARLKS